MRVKAFTSNPPPSFVTDSDTAVSHAATQHGHLSHRSAQLRKVHTMSAKKAVKSVRPVVTKATFTMDEVAAMTKSEIMEALEDEGGESNVIRRMSHTAMVKAYWMVLGTHGQQNVVTPAPRPVPAPSTKTPSSKTATAEAATATPSPNGKICGCGCGDTTRGGNWMPGHDAKYASMMKGGPKKQSRLCLCGCGDMTKGGYYRPGHDSKHFSSLLIEARETNKVYGHSRIDRVA
jgi:hypothetical protein